MSTKVRQAILRLGGAMLVALGGLHLAVTPDIARMIEHSTSPILVQWLDKPGIQLRRHLVQALELQHVG